MGSCLAYGLTATGGLCTCYYWFVAHKYLLLVSLTDYGDACSNVGYGTFRNAAILRTEDEYLNIVGTLSVGKCLASTVGKYQESIDLLSQLFEMSADGVCAFLVIHNATLWHQKYQEINATIIAAVTESRDNQSLTELYASVCETGVADTLVRGSYYLLRTKNQSDLAYTGRVEYSFHTLTLQRSSCEESACNYGTAILCERSRDGSPGRSREGRWTG